MRRQGVILITAGLLALSLIAAGSDGASAHATDPCGDPFDSNVGAAAVSWQDLCSLDVTQLPRLTDDDPTRLEVRLAAASAERTTPSIYTVRWDVGDCAHRLVFGDPLPDRPQVSQFTVDCDGPDGELDDCVASAWVVKFVCKTSRPAIDIPAPAVEDGALVWRLEFAGDIADLAGSYPPGTTLRLQASAASARAHSQRALLGDIACGGGVCAGVGSDLLDASPLTVTID